TRLTLHCNRVADRSSPGEADIRKACGLVLRACDALKRAGGLRRVMERQRPWGLSRQLDAPPAASHPRAAHGPPCRRKRLPTASCALLRTRGSGDGREDAIAAGFDGFDLDRAG